MPRTDSKSGAMRAAEESFFEYLRQLRMTEGGAVGKQFPVERWQREFLSAALFSGKYSRAALSLPRACGKTTLLAATAAAYIAGPLRRARAECVAVASSLNQAKILFKQVVAFIRPQIEREGSSVWRVTDNHHAAVIEHRPSGAVFRSLGSDPRRAHGLMANLYLLDEMAQWGNRVDEMYQALVTSLGKQPDARLIAIGTRPADKCNPFARMLDAPSASELSVCYANTDDADWDTMQAARRAYPFGKRWPAYRRVLLQAIEEDLKKAKTDSEFAASYRALRLNAGTLATGKRQLVQADVWEQAEIPHGARPPGACIWGIDLGGACALSAIVAFYPEGGELLSMAAVGNDPDLRVRGLRDGVGNHYQLCHADGDLLASPGKVPSIDGLIRAALNRYGLPSAIACDRWRAGELADVLTRNGIVLPVEFRGMGWRDGAEDVRLFRESLLTGKVRPVRSRLMRGSMREACTISDPAGNEKLVKAKQRGRDDVAAAAVLAVACARRLHRNIGAAAGLRYHGAA